MMATLPPPRAEPAVRPPPVSVATRRELARHEQTRLIEAYLRLSSHEEAAAIGTMQPHLDSVRSAKRTPWASFEAVVDRRLRDVPPHLARALPAALARLPWPDREVLRLLCVEELPQAEVAALFRRSGRWVRLRKSSALTALALRLWDADGRPRVPARPRG